MAPDVELAEEVEFGAHVVIHGGTRVGNGVVIQDAAVIGKPVRLGSRSSTPRRAGAVTLIGDEASVLTGAVILAGASVRHGAIVGDQAHVRERAIIGEEAVVGRGTAVDNDVTVGARVRIQTNCYVTAFSTIEDDVFVGPGVVMTNDHTMARHPADSPLVGVRLRRACRIGGGAVLCPGIEIGEEAFVAAGAVVTKSVPGRAVVMGVPAQPVRTVPEDDLLEKWL